VPFARAFFWLVPLGSLAFVRCSVAKRVNGKIGRALLGSGERRHESAASVDRWSSRW